MVNLILLVAAALLVFGCWRLLQVLLRPSPRATPRAPQASSSPARSLEQRLLHLPLSDPALLDELEQLHDPDLLLARAALRRRLVQHLRVRVAVGQRQEQWQQQRLLAALRAVQRQRFDASLRDLLPSAPTAADQPPAATTDASVLLPSDRSSTP